LIPLKDNVKTRHFPFVNLALIAANGWVFYRELTQPSPQTLETFIKAWSLIPARFLEDPWTQGISLFSSMFLHGGWMHFIGNMLYLWIFGDNVEDRTGHFRYLVFYLLTGAVAGLTQTVLSPLSEAPMIGASGAIAGVLGAYFLLYPRARILAAVPIWIFLRIVEIPAIFFLGFWFLLQAFQGYGTLMHGTGAHGGVAWWAHAGGFIAGGVLILLFKRSR
jgi:membrane associated rhomboid family serine protease